MGQLLDAWVDGENGGGGLKGEEKGQVPPVDPVTHHDLAQKARDTQAHIGLLPPSQQQAFIDRMSSDDFQAWVKNLPIDDKDKLEQLVNATSDPDKRLILWSEGNRGKAHDMALDAKKELETATGQRRTELEHILAAAETDDKEAKLELVKMRARWKAGQWDLEGPDGKDLTQSEINAMSLEERKELEIAQLEARKNKELALEKKYGINVTSEASNIEEAEDTPDGHDRTGDANKTKVWKSAELDHLGEQLDLLPTSTRSFITEFRRDTDERAGGHWDPGPRVLHCHSDNPATWLHEMGHAVDQHDDQGKEVDPTTKKPKSASQEYEDAMKYHRFDSKVLHDDVKALNKLADDLDEKIKANGPNPQLQAQLANLRGIAKICKDAELTVAQNQVREQLKGAGLTDAEVDAKMKDLMSPREPKDPNAMPGEGEKIYGGYGPHGYGSVEVKGVVYQHIEGNDYISSYDAHALPRLGHAEKSTNAKGMVPWKDGYVYARWNPDQSNAEHFFEEHAQLAMRDPARVYSDYVARPQAEVEALREKIKSAALDGRDATDLYKQLGDALLTQDSLRAQFDRVRTTLGVDHDAIDAAAAGLTPEQAELFKEQADRCSSSVQLEKLRDLYARGQTLGPAAIARGAATMRMAGLPPDEVLAFQRDARTCFTPEQLKKLTKFYVEGKRKYGEWVPDKLDNNEDNLGF